MLGGVHCADIGDAGDSGRPSGRRAEVGPRAGGEGPPGRPGPRGSKGAGSRVQSTFERTTEEGSERLARGLPALLATGSVGGIDVGMGVLALLLVEALTHNRVAGALAFTVGFVALTLADSELFTENLLVPIVAVAGGEARPRAVVRLWAGTLVMNLAGGWVIMAVVTAGLPEVRGVAVALGTHYARAGVNGASFATAVLGGTIVTLMTWMERASESLLGRLVAAVVAGFLLALGSLNHVIVASLEMFAGLQAHAPFGYLTWAKDAGWAVLGNLVGGIGLVTVLRLVQVGPAALIDRRRAGG
ncbi:MAG TPA: formate/nitrite transporter family protein [Acidimicrobiales bacterium]|nr:formate/nitrite transporter family protein [Acidimicrobiales bacterium]